jgi:hypothetical protein
MRSTFKTVFYVNGSKERNGIVPIMGRVTINGIVFNAIKFKMILRMFAVIKRGTPYVETDNYRNGKNKQPGVN